MIGDNKEKSEADRRRLLNHFSIWFVAGFGRAISRHGIGTNSKSIDIECSTDPTNKFMYDFWFWVICFEDGRLWPPIGPSHGLQHFRYTCLSVRVSWVCLSCAAAVAAAAVLYINANTACVLCHIIEIAINSLIDFCSPLAHRALICLSAIDRWVKHTRLHFISVSAPVNSFQR